MLKWLFPTLIGGKNEREIHRIRPTVARINEIEVSLQNEPLEKLVELTRHWQNHLSRYHPLDAPPRSRVATMDGPALTTVAASITSRFTTLRKEFPSLPADVLPTPEAIDAAKSSFLQIEPRFAKSRARFLESILPDAYAVVKNAARRLCQQEILVNGRALLWDMVHFDVQLIGGIAVHRGMIAEMQTGEGKTLVATLPVYLNALTGLGVHVITVNDYLAQRDSQWMGALFRLLGLTVGCIENQMQPHDRRSAYACDITYGTNSEFGFDYLRDNGIATTRDEQVQRGHYLAIIDEIDSVLIDDARTPLIITGPSSRTTTQFESLRNTVEQLVKHQTALCNTFAADAKRLLSEGDSHAAGRLLYKIKLAQPRNRQLIRFMENPDLRRLLDKTELSLKHGSAQKDAFKLKQDLLFAIDEKHHEADLLEKGRRFLSPTDPDSFTLPDLDPPLAAIDADPLLSREQRTLAKNDLRATLQARADRIHSISQLLKAYCLYERDVHYVVREGKVTIIDESTGREMPGRRWSDGLHQAVEAKERVTVERENQTFATVTIQNYFRLYEKLAGMTGTAETEAAEFHDIYQLDVLPIPTNTPNIRIDENDQIFKTRREKFAAVIAKIQQAHSLGQPVLVGTASVEASETLSRMLQRAKIPHSVLNAKFHQQEAEIVALAGQRGAVTVSTNMAGRGTDIKLGAGVAALGGLFVVGTERHPSRRVDRQLRGRCSRQGDPGRSQFFISLEDDLMRNHAPPEQMAALIEQSSRSGKSSSLGSLVESAQKQVEQRDYKSRKRVLDFDDVMNLQREIIYGYRNDILTTENTRKAVCEIVEEVVPTAVQHQLADIDPQSPDSGSLRHWAQSSFAINIMPEELDALPPDTLIPLLSEKILTAYHTITVGLPAEMMEQEERRMILSAIDSHWKDHLADMDELREGVYLRAQGQKDPLVEYKNEGYELFNAMIHSLKQNALQNLFHSANYLGSFLQELQESPPRP